MKLLYILNVAKRVNNFSYTSMIAARELGVEFHIAGNWSYASDEERRSDEKRYRIRIHQIDFIRTPYHPGNRKAYLQLKKLVQQERFDAIHCNTPIGGVLGRIVGWQCRVPKVIYQAHGFHFYEGASVLNWMFYYPVEKWLARCTDALITINREDYRLAKAKMKLRGKGNVYYVPGVGIDGAQFRDEQSVRARKRGEMNLSDLDIMLISTGELNENKNNTVIISALEKLKDEKIHYFLCGTGDKEQSLRQQAEKAGITQRVHFLGYRQDIGELLRAADIFVLSSYREGLPRSMMEAMASGLPCVASRVRGNTDLLEDGAGGFLCGTADIRGYAEAIGILAKAPVLRETMGRHNLQAVQVFSVETVTAEMKRIYHTEFGTAVVDD